jgi:hypothetical protein
MAPKAVHRHVVSALALFVILGVALLGRPTPVAADSEPAAVPDLASFTASVTDGNRKVLRGVYAPGVFALAVVQQPYASFVSRLPGTVTQFGMAAMHGVTGLLAHDSLSGEYFVDLTPGEPIVLIWGDGRLASFVVTKIYRFQATRPESVYSGFVDLETGKRTDAEGLFRKVYMGSRHVTLQTCIEKDGNVSWGRLIVIAEPAS